MSKYILKKDLPFAKSGTKVTILDIGIFVQRDDNGYKVCIDRLSFDKSHKDKVQEELKRLISEGWIEEVKPREWYIGLTKNDLPCYVGEGKPHEDKTHYNFLSSIDNKFELVKVREVIE